MAPETAFAAVAVFAAVFAGTGFLAWALLGRVSPARRRLQEVTSESAQLGGAGIAAGAKLVDEVDEKLARATRLLSKSPKELSRTRRRLAKAGYYGVRPVVVYSVAEMVPPVVLGLGTLWFFGRGTGLILGAIAAIMGILSATYSSWTPSYPLNPRLRRGTSWESSWKMEVIRRRGSIVPS